MSEKEIIEGGPRLIGYKARHWVDGKYSSFIAEGIIIKYRKVKGKGSGAGGITGGRYLIDYGNGKQYWRRRSDFTIIK